MIDNIHFGQKLNYGRVGNKIVSLAGDSRLKLRGVSDEIGELTHSFNEAKGRYVVRLQGGHRNLSVKPGNLILQTGQRAEPSSSSMQLLDAANSGDCGAMGRLLDGGLDVNALVKNGATDSKGQPIHSTALIQAVSYNQQAATRLLLDHDECRVRLELVKFLLGGFPTLLQLLQHRILRKVILLDSLLLWFGSRLPIGRENRGDLIRGLGFGVNCLTWKKDLDHTFPVCHPDAHSTKFYTSRNRYNQGVVEYGSTFLQGLLICTWCIDYPSH